MSPPPPLDLLIRGGTVIDPAREGEFRADVAVRDGRIVAVEAGLKLPTTDVIDATGKYVLPGLVDLHAHVYWGATIYGVEADKAAAVGGTTTFLDTGSAGCSNFPGLRRYVIEPAATRILALVHIGRSGLTSNLGELRDPRYLSVDGTVATIEANPDVAVGVKIRYSDNVVGTGRQARAALAAALEAAEQTGTWLMVHVARTPEAFDDLLAKLRPGDVITHAYSGHPGALVHHQTHELAGGARAAREHGVLFDIGHGQGSFGWQAAAVALDSGFPPDFISTDLHRGNIEGPVYDFPLTLTKFWHLGMALPDIVRRSTLAPARRLGLQVGTLAVGAEADIAVLEVVEAPVELTDSYGVTRQWDRRLRASATIRAGRRLDPAALGPRSHHPIPIRSTLTGKTGVAAGSRESSD